MTDPNVPMDRKKILKSAVPVAGNVATTITVPAGERWLLLNVAVELTTDATVANRLINIYTRDIAAVDKFRNTSNAIAASTTAAKYFSREISAVSTTVNSLGYQILDAGEDVYISVYLGQAGDAYDYLVEYLKVEI